MLLGCTVWHKCKSDVASGDHPNDMSCVYHTDTSGNHSEANASYEMNDEQGYEGDTYSNRDDQPSTSQAFSHTYPTPPATDEYLRIANLILDDVITAHASNTDGAGQGNEQRHGAEERGVCAICQDTLAVMLMRPCKHVCMCEECWQQFRSDNSNTNCPLCRGRLQLNKVEKIYLN